MRIRAENIGRFDTFDVNLNGLTVIAGINGSGKSTIGKAIYIALKGDRYLYNELIDNKYEIIVDTLGRLSFLLDRSQRIDKTSNSNLLDSNLFKEIEVDDSIISSIRRTYKHIRDARLEGEETLIIEDYFQEAIDLFNNEQVKQLLPKLLGRKQEYFDDAIKLLSAQADDENSEYLQKLLSHLIYSEFKNQISNLFSGNNTSKITLSDNMYESTIDIENNGCRQFSFCHKFPYDKILYVDDAFLLDRVGSHAENGIKDSLRERILIRRERLNHNSYSFKSDHKQDILSSLVKAQKQNSKNLVDEINLDNLISEFNEMILNVMKGELLYSDEDNEYVLKKKGKNIQLLNTASGTKSIALIDALLKNGLLGKDTFLIFDEPESHLHPEWQIKLAELLVLMVKKIQMKILINSHSPYFIEAIREYSKFHGIEKDCNYYFSTVDENDMSTIEDVTTDISIIYDTLAKPYKTLDAIYENLSK